MNAQWTTNCTFPTQIVEVLMHKVQKPTHYLSGSNFTLFLGQCPTPSSPQTHKCQSPDLKN